MKINKTLAYRTAFICLLLTNSSNARDRINPFSNPGFIPTVSAGGESVAPVEFVLKAVMPSSNNPLVNINGRVLEVGDEYSGYELISVSATSARLKRDTNIIKLELRPKRISDQGGEKS